MLSNKNLTQVSQNLRCPESKNKVLVRNFHGHQMLLASLLIAGMFGILSLGGCGSKKDRAFTATDLMVAPKHGHLEFQSDDQESEAGVWSEGRMVFKSFNASYRKMDVTLGIKLGWLGFGTQMTVGTIFTDTSEGGLVLSKVPQDAEAAIFADESGALQVREGEDFKARCLYQASFSLKFDGDAAITFSGSGLKGEVGRSKVLSMEDSSREVPVNSGATVGALESQCEAIYEREFRPKVQQDLARGIKAQMVIQRHFDGRVQALDKLLKGQQEHLEHLGEKWVAIGPTVKVDGNAFTVTGAVDAPSNGIWRTSSGETRMFEHKFLREETLQKGSDPKLRLMATDLWPKSTSDQYAKTMVMAGYIARNKAEYEAAVLDRRPFKVDTSLLKGGDSINL